MKKIILAAAVMFTATAAQAVGGNQFLGALSGSYIATGTFNTAIGENAGTFMRGGSNNTMLGYRAGYGQTGYYSGERNTGIGYRAGYNLRSGAADNTFIGYQAGYAITTGTGNILIGNNVTGSAGMSNFMNIGNHLYGDLSPGSMLTLEGDFVAQRLFGDGSNITGLPIPSTPDVLYSTGGTMTGPLAISVTTYQLIVSSIIPLPTLNPNGVMSSGYYTGPLSDVIVLGLQSDMTDCPIDFQINFVPNVNGFDIPDESWASNSGDPLTSFIWRGITFNWQNCSDPGWGTGTQNNGYNVIVSSIVPVPTMTTNGEIQAIHYIGGPKVYTLAQMEALAPARPGMTITISDSAAPYSDCKSTGTAAGAWVLTNTATHCQ
jgi:hypothetical protein